MTKNYKLVNPYVIGSMNTSFNADSSLGAAKLAYESLSQYFGNHMPVFRFTLKRLSTDNKVVGGSSKSFLHFEVNEVKGRDDNVKYEIKEINGGNNIKSFQERLNKVATQDEKKGGSRAAKSHGKKYVDRDDDIDSEYSDYFDTEVEKPRKGPLVYEPIVYYWYDPFVYPTLDRWYVPTFVLPIQPRVVFDSHSLLYLGR
jgi:hypothetical protein